MGLLVMLRRRGYWLKLVLLIPAVWFCIAILNSRFSGPQIDDASGIDRYRGRRGREAGGENQVKVVQGFGPPKKLDVAESLGGDGYVPEKAVPLSDEQENQRNIPKPAQFVDNPNSPIYQRGPNMPGELGKAVRINKKNLSGEDRRKYDAGWQANAFNQYASDMMSIHRSLPEAMDKECKDEPYDLASYPDTSVVVCFHNEAWSVLLRSVHSILERSPSNLLKEIILVDDYSDKPHLKEPLVTYMSQFPKVKVLRMPKREGLIRARLFGAEHASGKVLTFLDSHIECTEGWLPPLLSRIHKDPHNVVCPVIDVVDDDTFQYHYSKAIFTQVGGFDWSLQFNWHPIPERDKKNSRRPIDPVPSPTMAGGLFAIDKAYFEHLGSYDPGFDIWGGENLEISFKIWMCGGRLEIAPCSHVGHIFRKRSPYKWRTGVNVLKRNTIRLAEVWLDDYKKYYYDRINNNLGDFGDISERKALRERIGCKSFKWFLDNIYPEMFVPGDAIASGEVRNSGQSGTLCLDSMVGREHNEKPISVYPCHGQGGNQYWMLSKDGEIRRDESCVDFAGHEVMIFPCHGMKGNQLWKYDHDIHRLYHDVSRKCLEMARDGARLTMNSCDSSNPYQQWVFKSYNETKAREVGMLPR